MKDKRTRNKISTKVRTKRTRKKEKGPKTKQKQTNKQKHEGTNKIKGSEAKHCSCTHDMCADMFSWQNGILIINFTQKKTIFFGRIRY